MTETFAGIDWETDENIVVGDVSLDVTETSSDRSMLLRYLAESFEQNSPQDFYVYCYEYQTPSNETRWYVGETANLTDRIYTHTNERNVRNIERIECVEDRETARERERELSYEIAIEKHSTDVYGGR